MRLAELPRGDEQPGRAKLEATALEARHDLAGEVAADGVGLREDQGPFERHRGRGAYRGPRVCVRRACLAAWPRSATGSSTVTGVSQYGHTCHARSSGRWQASQA